MNKNCIEKFNYDRKNVEITDGFKLIVCIKVSDKKIFHAHIRHSRYAGQDVELNRYHIGSKATVRLKPLPFLYESKYADGVPTELKPIFDKLPANQLLQ